jgi:hypothetical protein
VLGRTCLSFVAVSAVVSAQAMDAPKYCGAAFLARVVAKVLTSYALSRTIAFSTFRAFPTKGPASALTASHGPAYTAIAQLSARLAKPIFELAAKFLRATAIAFIGLTGRSAVPGYAVLRTRFAFPHVAGKPIRAGAFALPLGNGTALALAECVAGLAFAFDASASFLGACATIAFGL